MRYIYNIYTYFDDPYNPVVLTDYYIDQEKLINDYITILNGSNAVVSIVKESDTKICVSRKSWDDSIEKRYYYVGKSKLVED